MTTLPELLAWSQASLAIERAQDQAALTVSPKLTRRMLRELGRQAQAQALPPDAVLWFPVLPENLKYFQPPE